VLFLMIMATEDEFRDACIEQGTVRHGRTETMLLRWLLHGDIDRKTA
jgi:hypothetical protein